LSKNWDKQRVKLDLWTGKVCIETLLTAPVAQIVFLFSRESGTDFVRETTASSDIKAMHRD